MPSMMCEEGEKYLTHYAGDILSALCVTSTRCEKDPKFDLYWHPQTTDTDDAIDKRRIFLPKHKRNKY